MFSLCRCLSSGMICVYYGNFVRNRKIVGILYIFEITAYLIVILYITIHCPKIYP